MKKTRILRSLGATALAAVVGVSIAPAAVVAPAAAERAYINDGDNPAVRASGDITKVQIDHGLRAVEAKVTYQEVPGTGLVIFYDTRRGNPGPEFRLNANIIDEANSVVDGWYLYRVNSFTDRVGARTPQARCIGDRVSRTREIAIFTRMPRRCLAIGGTSPSRVRISVRSSGREDLLDASRVSDWAPQRHVFGPWLRAN